MLAHGQKMRLLQVCCNHGTFFEQTNSSEHIEGNGYNCKAIMKPCLCLVIPQICQPILLYLALIRSLFSLLLQVLNMLIVILHFLLISLDVGLSSAR